MAFTSTDESLPSKYQVFINFRGDELRNSFVAFLVKAMRFEKINVFTDEFELRGTDLDNLFRRIEESRVALAIFSERYTESHWCLDELVKMKELMEQAKLVVIPVFFRLNATACKKLEGSFGDKFRKLEWEYRSEPERIKKWKQALISVSNNIGLKSDIGSDESKFVDSIVENVKRVLSEILTTERHNSTSGGSKQRFTEKTPTMKIEEVTEGRGIESINSSYSLEVNLGVTRVLRDERPSSKILTISSFSVIKGREEPYESSVFEAAGYKWRLVLYVNGNKKDGGKDHISLYVRIEETTESLRRGLEVNVDLKLFVYNGNRSKYLTVTDGLVKRYSAAKKEWGYGQLIPHSTFFNTNEGYIEQDTGSFGAEIFIIKPAQEREKVTFISNPRDNIFTWKIPNFSTLEDKFYYSEDFLVEDRYWSLGFNPKGNGGGRPHALPIFLYAQGHKENAVVTNTWGAVNLRIKNQQTSDHKQRYSAAWYPIRSGYGVGVQNIILFSDLNDASKGYLVNDAIIFEAEMVKVSETNIVSS